VYYDRQIVGAFTADLLINDSLIVELKAIQSLAKAHEVQLVNYLVATGIDEGLLLNFGAERLEYKKKFRLLKQGQVSF
jgi:GxxExxY protein